MSGEIILAPGEIRRLACILRTEVCVLQLSLVGSEELRVMLGFLSRLLRGVCRVLDGVGISVASSLSINWKQSQSAIRPSVGERLFSPFIALQPKKTMSKKTLRDLYLEQLQDIYSAETQLLEALPKMAWKAQNVDLKKAFGHHLEETRGQVERLESIFEGHPSVQAGDHTCKAMKGLLREGSEALEDSGNSDVVDAHLVAAAYRVEHYEMAAYESAISMARALNEKDDVRLLEVNLREERAAGDGLTKLADGGAFSAGLHAAAVEA